MTVPATSQPSPRVSLNIIGNESLAWERFQKAVTDEDINVCYDMSLKDFERFGVHNLFKVIVFALSLKIHTYIYILPLTIYSSPFCRVCQSL